jgi:DNA-nicking Smr family endonuclease
VAKKPKPGDLSPQDKEVWEQVTRSVTPLEGRPDAPALKPRRRIRDRLDDRPLPDEWHVGMSPAPRASVDRKTRRKISKGHQDVDRSADLHGLNQDQAFRQLKSIIEGAIRRGDKTLLVVTGKGGRRFSQTGPDTPVAYRTRDEFDQFGGVLKRMVPIWLEGPELKPFVESYGEASKEHGGEGALYILLRKRLPGSRKKQGKSP